MTDYEYANNTDSTSIYARRQSKYDKAHEEFSLVLRKSKNVIYNFQMEDCGVEYRNIFIEADENHRRNFFSINGDEYKKRIEHEAPLNYHRNFC